MGMRPSQKYLPRHWKPRSVAWLLLWGVYPFSGALSHAAACGVGGVLETLTSTECQIFTGQGLVITRNGSISVKPDTSLPINNNYYGLLVGKDNPTTAFNAETIVNNGTIAVIAAGVGPAPDYFEYGNYSRGIGVRDGSSVKGIVNTGTITALGHGIGVGQSSTQGYLFKIPVSTVVDDSLVQKKSKKINIQL